MFWLNSVDGHSAAGYRARYQKCASFDPVRNDVVLGPVQFANALDDYSSCPGALDFRAHLIEEISQIANFRLLRRAFDYRCAFGKNGGHHHIIGAEHSWSE